MAKVIFSTSSTPSFPPLNREIIDKVFGVHPFFKNILKKMNKDLWGMGLDKGKMARLEQLLRISEELGDNEPLRFTEKTQKKMQELKKDIERKGSHMATEVFNVKRGDIEIKEFYKRFPEMKNPPVNPVTQPINQKIETVYEITDGHLPFGAEISDKTNPKLLFHVCVEDLFNDFGVESLFPETDFGKYRMNPRIPNQELNVIIDREDNAAKFQLFFSLKYVLPFISETLKIHLKEIFSSVERCSRLVNLLKSYGETRGLYWRLAMIDVMLPIIYCNSESEDLFFRGGKIDFQLNGVTDFSIGSWFTKENEAIEINEENIKNDLNKFLELYKDEVWAKSRVKMES